MKYTFDVDEKNNKFEIRLEITKTGGYNSTAAKTIECSEVNPNWTVSLEKLLVDIIDNMRLTVQERTEVYKNSNILTLFPLYRTKKIIVKFFLLKLFWVVYTH